MVPMSGGLSSCRRAARNSGCSYHSRLLVTISFDGRLYFCGAVVRAATGAVLDAEDADAVDALADEDEDDDDDDDDEDDEDDSTRASSSERLMTDEKSFAGENRASSSGRLRTDEKSFAGAGENRGTGGGGGGGGEREREREREPRRRRRSTFRTSFRVSGDAEGAGASKTVVPPERE